MNQPPALMTVEAARNWVESERAECAKTARLAYEDFTEVGFPRNQHLRRAFGEYIAGKIEKRITP